MNPVVRTVAVLVVVGIAAAVLIVLFANARHRAKVSQCRNNLRHLGILVVNNWQGIDPELSGRKFWQAVREVQYLSVKGKWVRYPEHDMMLCPVYGKTPSRLGDPLSIDYRGPRSVRDTIRETPAAEPVGADRPGNHPGGGGHVLRLDTSVQESERVEPILEAAPASAGIWAAADRALTD